MWPCAPSPPPPPLYHLSFPVHNDDDSTIFLLEICPLKDLTDLRMHFLKNSPPPPSDCSGWRQHYLHSFLLAFRDSTASYILKTLMMMMMKMATSLSLLGSSLHWKAVKEFGYIFFSRGIIVIIIVKMKLIIMFCCTKWPYSLHYWGTNTIYLFIFTFFSSFLSVVCLYLIW